MACAKKQVTCHIIGRDGLSFVGRNDCRNPQVVCPRLPGEGYEKCKTICDQIGHAEEVALMEAGDMAQGGTAVLSGIGYYCRECQLKLFAAGIKNLRLE